jgi:hypothetical protein
VPEFIDRVLGMKMIVFVQTSSKLGGSFQILWNCVETEICWYSGGGGGLGVVSENRDCVEGFIEVGKNRHIA